MGSSGGESRQRGKGEQGGRVTELDQERGCSRCSCDRDARSNSFAAHAALWRSDAQHLSISGYANTDDVLLKPCTPPLTENDELFRQACGCGFSTKMGALGVRRLVTLCAGVCHPLPAHPTSCCSAAGGLGRPLFPQQKQRCERDAQTRGGKRVRTSEGARGCETPRGPDAMLTSSALTDRYYSSPTATAAPTPPRPPARRTTQHRLRSSQCGPPPREPRPPPVQPQPQPQPRKPLLPRDEPR